MAIVAAKPRSTQAARVWRSSACAASRARKRKNPGLSLHLRISDRVADLVRQPLDAVVRYGPLSDSSLVAIPLIENNRRALCASPDYLRQHGAPEHVDDLLRHNCLRFVWSEQLHERWRFTLPGGERIVSVTGNRISDDADADPLDCISDIDSPVYCEG